MREAIKLAEKGMQSGHGGPFGCVIVRSGEIVGRGHNRVTSTNDPTAHAEVTAIRDACANLETFQLTDCELYTSCEPCPMCLSAALWARVERVVFAADRHDAASVGFDDAVFYEYFDNADRQSLMPVSKLKLGHPEAPAILEPFNTWNTLDSRIDY